MRRFSEDIEIEGCTCTDESITSSSHKPKLHRHRCRRKPAR